MISIMKKLFILILFIPVLGYSQKNSLSIFGGINYNLVPRSSEYEAKNTNSGGFNFISGFGGQLGINYQLAISPTFRLNGLLELQQRNNLNRDGIIFTDYQGNITGQENTAIKNTVLAPGLLAGISPFDAIEFGAGFSVPVLLYSYSRFEEGYTTYDGEFKRFKNHYFRSASLNSVVYFLFIVSPGFNLKASYYRGITSRSLAGKEYDNLFTISAGIKLTGK